MGGTGSGPTSVKARAFDNQDLAQRIVTYIKHHLLDKEARPITEEIVQTWENDLETHAKRLKKAIEDDNEKQK